MTRKSIESIEKEKDHQRKQASCDFYHKIKIVSGWCLFFVVIVCIILSIIAFGAYVFKCPYVSDKAIDLLMQGWIYIVTLIVGNILPRFGFKEPKD